MLIRPGQRPTNMRQVNGDAIICLPGCWGGSKNITHGDVVKGLRQKISELSAMSFSAERMQNCSLMQAARTLSAGLSALGLTLIPTCNMVEFAGIMVVPGTRTAQTSYLTRKSRYSILCPSRSSQYAYQRSKCGYCRRDRERFFPAEGVGKNSEWFPEKA